MTDCWKNRWFGAIEQNQKLQIARLLCDPNSDIDAKNDIGNSALHLAVAAGDFDLTMFLLRRGADVDIVNARTRRNALMVAVEKANITLTYALLHHSASLCNPLAKTTDAQHFVEWLHKVHSTHTKSRTVLETALLRAWRP